MSIKFSARNSKAGNGCTNFMGAWDFVVLSAGESLHAYKGPRFWGEGGGILVLRGECQLFFMSAGIFLISGSVTLYNIPDPEIGQK